jgi:hypothetical protein
VVGGIVREDAVCRSRWGLAIARLQHQDMVCSVLTEQWLSRPPPAASDVHLPLHWMLAQLAAQPDKIGTSLRLPSRLHVCRCSNQQLPEGCTSGTTAMRWFAFGGMASAMSADRGSWPPPVP